MKQKTKKTNQELDQQTIDKLISLSTVNQRLKSQIIKFILCFVGIPILIIITVNLIFSFLK